MELSLLTAAMSINTSETARVDPITVTNLPNETILEIFARVDFSGGDSHSNIMLVNRHFYELVKVHKSKLRWQIAILQFSKAATMNVYIHYTNADYSISYRQLRTFELQDSQIRTLVACVDFHSNDPDGPKSTAARRLVVVALHPLAAMHELRVAGGSEAAKTLLLLSGSDISRRSSKWLRLACMLLWQGIANTWTRLGLTQPLMPIGDSAAPVALEDLAVEHGLTTLVELVGDTYLDSRRLSNTLVLLSQARDRIQASLTLFMGAHFYGAAQNSGTLSSTDIMMRPYRPNQYPTLGALRTADLLLGSSQKGRWLKDLVDLCTEAARSELRIASAASSNGAGSGEDETFLRRRKVQMAMHHDWHAEVERIVTQDETLIWTDYVSTFNSIDCLTIMSFPLRRFKMLRGGLEARSPELDMKYAPYGTYMKIHDKFDMPRTDEISSGTAQAGESTSHEGKIMESLRDAFCD